MFGPTSEQSKLVESKLKIIAPQLSAEPLSKSEARIVALPRASKYTVKFCATALGETVSNTVTTAAAESMLPYMSVAIS